MNSSATAASTPWAFRAVLDAPVYGFDESIYVLKHVLKQYKSLLKHEHIYRNSVF